MAKPMIFSDFCKLGITASKVKGYKLDGTAKFSALRTVLKVNKDSLTVIDQGHHVHKINRRKFRGWLKQKGML